jgi:hypothetical protein
MENSGTCQECSKSRPSTQNDRLYVSLSTGGKPWLRIGKDVIRVLGSPSFITFLVNWSVPSLAIIECPPSDPMSFLVPMNLMDSNRMGFRIYGHQFMVDLASVAGLEKPGTYRFYGRYDEDRKAVIVDCRVYRKVSRIRPAKDAG